MCSEGTCNVYLGESLPRHQMVLAVVLEVVVDEEVGEAMPEGCGGGGCIEVEEDKEVMIKVAM